MAVQSLFSHAERERKLDQLGDSLAALDTTVDFQAIADRVAALLPMVDHCKGGRTESANEILWVSISGHVGTLSQRSDEMKK